MNNKGKMNGLYVVTVWDENRPATFAVVASDMEGAEKIAIELCKDGRLEEQKDLPDPYIDSELSTEVTCAGDKDGQVYNIKLVPEKKYVAPVLKEGECL